MSLPFAIAVYWIFWWLVLFTILPIGVRTQAEEGNVAPGTAESAPAVPNLLVKLLATTVVSAILFAIAYAVIAFDLVGLDDVPFLPTF